MTKYTVQISELHTQRLEVEVETTEEITRITIKINEE